MATKTQEATALMQSMTIEELDNLIPVFNQILKAKRAARATNIVAKQGFMHGDILSWVSTRGRRAGERFYFKFDHMNRAGTAAQGPQCTKDGAVIGGTCTVAPMYIDIVNGKIIK
jgi:hypothetical protein